MSRVLIVEDDDESRQAYESSFRHPPRGFVSRYGDVKFETIVGVRGRDKALDELQAASDQGWSFDILVLDLSIPEKEDDHDLQHCDSGHGLEVQKKAPQGTAVVVVSDYGTFNNVKTAFREGALDFLKKPVIIEQVMDSAMQAWEKKWMSCRHRESQLWKDRLLMQLQQFKDEVADRFTTLLTSRAGRLLNAVDSVAEGLDDRFLLSEEREPDDSIVKSLKQIRSETEQMLQRASELRQRISPRERRVKPVDAMEILRSVSDKLYPAQIFRRTRVKLPDPAPPSVMIGSFSEDVAAILEEVLFGSITAYPSLDKSRSGPLSSTWNEVVVSVNEKDDSVSIIIEDAASPEPLKPYDPLTAPTEELRRRHREWGIWLAQRTAHNIGAQLTVEQVDDRKTRITLILPATHHACTTHNR